MKLALAAMKRIESPDNAQKKCVICRALQNQTDRTDYLKISRPGRVAYRGTAL